MASNKKFATWAVSLTNFLDSSCIVAGASGLTLWTSALKLDNFQVGLLGALSANALSILMYVVHLLGYSKFLRNVLGLPYHEYLSQPYLLKLIFYS